MLFVFFLRPTGKKEFRNIELADIFKKPQVRAKSRVKGNEICFIKLPVGFPNAFEEGTYPNHSFWIMKMFEQNT